MNEEDQPNANPAKPTDDGSSSADRPGTEPLGTDTTGTPRPRGPTTSLGLALLLSGLYLAFGIAVAWIATAGSWIITKVGDADPSPVFRDDIIGRGPSSYEFGLLNWPYVAAAALAAASVILAINAILAPRARGPSRTAILSSWALSVYATFLCALVGVRWLGFTLARAMDPGATWLYLGIAPIVLLSMVPPMAALGILVFRKWAPTPGLAHARIRRLAGYLAVTAGATLFLLALLPLAKSSQNEVYRFDELTMAALLDGAGPALALAKAFYWAHVALWCMLAGSVLVWAVLRDVPAVAPSHWKQRTPKAAIALGVPAIGLGAATAMFYLALFDIADIMTPTLAFVLPLCTFGTLILWIGIVADALGKKERVHAAWASGEQQ